MAERAAQGQEQELRSILETQHKRLLVMDKALSVMKEEDKSRKVKRNQELNMKAMDKLKSPIGDNLDKLWNVSKMKAAYYPLLSDFKTWATLFEVWKRNPRFLEALEEANNEFIGEDKRFYVLSFTFPNQFKDHLMNLRNFLGSVKRDGIAYKRIGELLKWLDEKQSRLSSIKGFNEVMDGTVDDEVIVAKVDGESVIGKKSSRVAIYLSVNYLAFTIASAILSIGAPKVHYDYISYLTLEKSNAKSKSSLTLEGSMVFFSQPKVVIVKNEAEGDKFYTAFKELNEGLI